MKTPENHNHDFYITGKSVDCEKCLHLYFGLTSPKKRALYKVFKSGLTGYGSISKLIRESGLSRATFYAYCKELDIGWKKRYWE